jgi:catechol 2,3-dioxygenase-like lactoylglutathione lyase family enzyme
MINGVHFLLYSKDADADRAFVRDVLGFKAIDVGGGWLVFGLPPAEMGVHPGDGKFVQSHAEHSLLGTVMYLMCDDLRATVAELGAKGVVCTQAVEAQWGITTTVPLPSGGRVGLYQPKHVTAIG